ncbi:MAG TPA: ATP-binding protein [Flavobacteriales bacterium]|jgi:two-component system NtrC family sensor kinase|nr:sensor histidine kinase [Flavobacteriales bacterium]HQW87233.1 ATP-binding protein [Flavobacteriales bacterium]
MGDVAHDATGLNEGAAVQLRERIKELQCLYAMARVAQEPHADRRTLVEAALATIPQGWQWPERARAAVILDDEHIGDPPGELRRITAPITINGQQRGQLLAGYPDEDALPGTPVFLPEEEQLLETLATEMAQLIERQEHREQRMKMEAHLRHNDRLMLLSELTAGIAHELNTPLGNVLGYAELLKTNETDPARREDLQRIIDSAIIGREVVKKLMYFSCEMPSQFRVLDVNELITGALRLVRRQCEERQVQVETRFAEALPPVRLDPVQFEQVIINLVLNALTAMPAAGALRITTHGDAGRVCIDVTDNGSGIAPDVLPRIFQPFFTTKPAGEGTGLGLSLVHGIVQGHNGSITVGSTLGEGTTFHLTFPAAA